ncbi:MULTISPECIES: phospholipid carrier-dependent glycosyltransferase [unclassified Sphingomonas]|uniref:phospholipid carrier-dependent glycosyltransferase n=1 Tax=unclassified Sphingomonas TaxID=196159 RepID=UPI000BD9BD88|nr:MAG: dolichyl-phosphate-mannose--protein mannosyltransferase [Sphingomonas sp. 32-62-10]
MKPDSHTPRPWHQAPFVAMAIGLAAQILFLINLARPTKPVFDETHYVPAANYLLTLGGPLNIEHPLLGKEIIALGILLFGDNSFGWRFFSTIAATAVVVGVFAIAWLLIGRVRPAAFAALFAILNFTVFIQARIAMLDGYMAAFTVTGIATLIWAMHAPPERILRRLALSGMLFGLAVGAKWAAIPFVAFAVLAIMFVPADDAPPLHRRRVTAVLLFGGVSLIAYFVTFAPAFFYARDPLTIGTLLPFQAIMYAQQTQPLPPHTYQSNWWTWPLDIRPIWYLYEPVDGAVRGILLVGNPAIMWGGLVAVAACIYAAVRDQARVAGMIAGLWIGAYLPWIIIPKKVGFFYYYYLPSIFLCLALAAAFDHFGKGRLRDADMWFAGLAATLFAYFYPILSAAALPSDQAFLNWMWFFSWR